MSHQPLALKYRPATFSEVISQGHVTRTLQNALNGGRIAHAYLFAGPRGSGKTTTARLLARALNCDRGVSGEPCGECPNCIAVAGGRSLDVIEIDAASNRGIDDIKELREAVKYAAAQGRYKVYIIDEVHQLSKDAFNALLKTLEEPPRFVVFVLATTEPHRIPATILSRCQRFDFRPIPLAAIRERLTRVAEREGIQLEEAAGFAIARKADGSLRDALSLLDQVVAFGGESIDLDQLRRLIGVPDEERYFELTQLLAEGDAGRALAFVRDLRAAGYDLEEFYTGFLEHLRNCLLFALGDGMDLAEVPERYHAAYESEAATLGGERLIRMLTLATDEEQIFRRSSQQSLVLEVLLVRLALLDRTIDIEPLLAAIGSGGDESAAARGQVPSRSAFGRKPAGRKASGARPAGAQQPDDAGQEAIVSTDPEALEDLSLERLLGAWDEVVDAVHAARPSLAALLRGVRPSLCTAEEIVLDVPADAEFRREQLAIRGALGPLAGVLQERWNFGGHVRVAGLEAAATALGQGRPARPELRDLAAREAATRLEGDALLRQIVDLFDADVVRVQSSAEP